MDEALRPLVEDDPPEDILDLSPAGRERERRRWTLIDPAHLDLYVLWKNLSGMGGETLGQIWDLAQRPGSAALFRDFAVLSAREKRLKAQKKAAGEMREQARQLWGKKKGKGRR